MVKASPGIAAVVLAAGSSQRMGEANKLHLPIDGVPLLRRSVQTLLKARLERIVVVLGYEQDITRGLIEDLPVDITYNDAHLDGQMTSVHCGLRALGDGYDGIMIALGDQPALRSTDLDEMIDAFAARDGGEVLIPTHQGERGNPILISDACRQDILAGTRNLGCRKFIERNPALVCKLEMSNPAVVIDLDTPEQYARFIDDDADSPTLKQQVS